MPPKSRKNKNARRLRSAEQALRKIQPLPPSRQGKPKVRVQAMSVPPQMLHSRGMTMALAYADSIRNHRLVGNLHLPSFRHTMPYTTKRHTAIFSTVTGATAVTAAFINPYLAPFTGVFFQQDNPANTPTNYSIGSVLATNVASPAGLPIGDDTTGTNGATSVGLTDQVSVGASAGYTAYVRPHGIRFRIDFTGTELNKGGLLTIFHGGTGYNLTLQDIGRTSSGALSFGRNAGLAQGALSPNIANIMRIGDSYECVFRPTDPEFKEVHSQYWQGLVGAGPTGMVTMNGPISDAGILQQVQNQALTSGANEAATSHWGHNFGFVLTPAASVGAAAFANYVVTVEILTDELVFNSASLSQQTLVTATKSAYADAAAEAHIRNALSTHHAASAFSELVPHARSTLVSLGKQAISGAAAYVGGKMMQSLAPSLAYV